jgi:hypothetical protein
VSLRKHAILAPLRKKVGSLEFYNFVDRFILKKYNKPIGKESNLKYEEA